MCAEKLEFATKDNLILRGEAYAVAKAKAVVLLIHGFGEHGGRYKHLAAFFNDMNVAMVAFDRRGEGLSDGRRAYAPGYDALLDDMTIWLDYVKDAYKNVPLFMYGHSMGGHLLMSYMLKFQPDVSGYICTGPWIRLAIQPPKFILALLPVLAKIMPKVSQSSNIDVKDLSTDLSVGEAYKKDPLVGKSLTFGLAAMIMKAADLLYLDKTPLSKPMLLMHGVEDKIISVEGSRVFKSNHPVNLTYVEWPGMRHEIHNEVDKQKVFTTIKDWINSNI